MICKAYEVYSVRSECLELYTKQSRVLLDFIDPVEIVKWSQERRYRSVGMAAVRGESSRGQSHVASDNENSRIQCVSRLVCNLESKTLKHNQM